MVDHQLKKLKSDMMLEFEEDNEKEIIPPKAGQRNGLYCLKRKYVWNILKPAMMAKEKCTKKHLKRLDNLK